MPGFASCAQKRRSGKRRGLREWASLEPLPPWQEHPCMYLLWFWDLCITFIQPKSNTGVGSHSLLQENLPNPGIEPRSPALQADSFTIWATREVQKQSWTPVMASTHSSFAQMKTLAHWGPFSYLKVLCLGELMPECEWAHGSPTPPYPIYCTMLGHF